MHYSVTIVKTGGDINPALLDFMHEAFADEANAMGIHAIALEHGAQLEHLHLQALMATNMHAAKSVNTWIKHKLRDSGLMVGVLGDYKIRVAALTGQICTRPSACWATCTKTEPKITFGV